MQQDAVHIEGLREFLNALRKYAPEVRKEFNKEARGSLGRIVVAARGLASWSKRIPGAIGPVVTTKALGVRMSKRKAPHGGIYERGSKGHATAVRHPLYGNRDFWFSTPIRPVLAPAVEANREEVVEDMFDALDRVRKNAGLS